MAYSKNKESQFIELRIKGSTFENIAQEIQVSKQTLISWNQKTEIKEVIQTDRPEKSFHRFRLPGDLYFLSWIIRARVLRSGTTQQRERDAQSTGRYGIQCLASALEGFCNPAAKLSIQNPDLMVDFCCCRSWRPADYPDLRKFPGDQGRANEPCEESQIRVNNL